MRGVFSAIPLALRQLADRQTLALLLKSLALTLLALALTGGALWWAAERWLLPLAAAWGPDGEFAARAVAFVTLLLLLWLWFRALAMMVLGLFSDAIVASVEQDHYPHAAARAVGVPVRQGLAMGLRSALRAIGWNLLASPLYLILLFTGIGLPIALLLVNMLVLGRDLESMVLARHPHAAPLDGASRHLLGLVSAAVFLVPVGNLLAPVFGAALATHVIHRRTDIS